MIQPGSDIWDDVLPGGGQRSDFGEVSRASQDRTSGEEFKGQLGPQGLARECQP